MAEDRKPDDRIAPRAPRTAGEAAAPLEVRDEKPLAHGGEVEEAAPPREDEAARPCLDGAGEHAAEAPRAKRAPLSAAQKVGVGVAAALSVALIAVSAYFVAAPAVEGSQAGDLLATTQEAGLADRADEPAAADEQQQAEEQDGADGADGAAAGDSAGADASAPAAGAPAPLPNGAAGDGAASEGSASASSSASARPATVTVSVTVDSSAADGRVSGGANPTFEQGATVYDALMACGLSVNASSTPLGIYVNAIGGLAEKEYPGESGWKYSVNGEVIMRSCDSVVLQDGDVVLWFYAR